MPFDSNKPWTTKASLSCWLSKTSTSSRLSGFALGTVAIKTPPPLDQNFLTRTSQRLALRLGSAGVVKLLKLKQQRAPEKARLHLHWYMRCVVAVPDPDLPAIFDEAALGG